MILADISYIATTKGSDIAGAILPALVHEATGNLEEITSPLRRECTDPRVKNGLSFTCLNADKNHPYPADGPTPYRVQVIGYYHDHPQRLDDLGYDLGKLLMGNEAVGHAAFRITDMRGKIAEKSYISYPYGTTFDDDTDDPDYNHRMYVEFCVDEKRYLAYAQWAIHSEFLFDSDDPIVQQIDKVDLACKTGRFSKFFKDPDFKLSRFLLTSKRERTVLEVIEKKFHSQIETCAISAISLDKKDKIETYQPEIHAPLLVRMDEKIYFFGEKRQMLLIDTQENLATHFAGMRVFVNDRKYSKIRIPASLCQLIEKKTSQKLAPTAVVLDQNRIGEIIGHCLEEVRALKKLETPLSRRERQEVEAANRAHLEEMRGILGFQSSDDVEKLLLLNDESYQQGTGLNIRNATEIIAKNIFTQMQRDPLKTEWAQLETNQKRFREIFQKYQRNRFQLKVKATGIQAVYGHSYTFIHKNCSYAARAALRVILGDSNFYSAVITNPKKLVKQTKRYLKDIFGRPVAKSYVQIVDNGPVETTDP